jgi:hypothetical protein
VRSSPCNSVTTAANLDFAAVVVHSRVVSGEGIPGLGLVVGYHALLPKAESDRGGEDNSVL